MSGEAIITLVCGSCDWTANEFKEHVAWDFAHEHYRKSGHEMIFRRHEKGAESEEAKP